MALVLELELELVMEEGCFKDMAAEY